jgi:multiple sugar transport system permease protein
MTWVAVATGCPNHNAGAQGDYFQFALVLSDIHSRTLIVAASNFVGEGVTDWGALMAAVTLIAFPPVVVTFLGQRWLVAG